MAAGALPGILANLPTNLVTKSGVQATASVLEGKDYVNLYFSAHWCPPCRGFTPSLAAWHTRNAGDKKFETIFVSSDRTKSDFDEYYGEMPWTAIPFEERGAAATLSSKLKVQGIPTMAVVDAKTGEVITTDGREGVSGDGAAANYPWRPKTFWEIMEGQGVQFTDAASSVTTAADLKSFDYVGVYFSAHWCGPCRAFTPRLSEWFASIKEKHNTMLVFASSDRSREQFDEYLSEMPWRAISFDDAGRAAVQELKGLCNVRGIPTLSFFDKSGKLVVPDARGKVMEAPTEFPWPAKPVESLSNAADGINDRPTVVLFTDKLTASDADMRAALAEVAGPLFAKVQAGDGSAQDIQFTVATSEDRLTDRLRAFAKISGDKDGDAAGRVVIFNIPGQNLLVGDLKAYTAADVQQLVTSFLAGTASMTALR